jgi:flagellar FliL protein
MAAKKKDTADSAAGGAKKRGGKAKLIAGVLCVGVAGGAYLLGTKSATSTSEAAAATTTTLVDGCATRRAEEVPKHVVDLPVMSINLAEGHFLRASFALGICDDVAPEEADGLKTAPASDIIVADLSGRKMAELSTPTGREAAKDRLKERITAAYPAVVFDVYFVEFVMQ